MVHLSDGDSFELEIRPVKKRIGEATVRMLAYNGSIPGPTLVAPQGATLKVRATNRGDMDATVHWHGLRLENRFDGTHETQAPIPVGEAFGYEVQLPDPGAYWYHPHIREDYGQELGLYGNILVVPEEPGYWPPVDRELVLTLDDLLLEDGKVAAFSRSETTHVAMGRFGNVMLVAGEPHLTLTARRDEVVRLYLTNTANTRVFNVTLPGAHEARRRRQRALRARGDRRGGARRPPRSASSSTSTSRSRASSPSSTARQIARIASRRSGLRATTMGRPPPRRSRTCGRTPTWQPSGTGSSPT